MPDAGFEGLSKQLIEHGVAPRFARRIAAELKDHCDDLERELIAAKRLPDEAAVEARARLGDEAAIARELVRRPELRCWIYRSALIVHCLAALVSAAVVVVAPFHALVEYRATLGRYFAALGAASVVTFALLFVMQLAIGYWRDAAKFLLPGFSLAETGMAVLVEELAPVFDLPPAAWAPRAPAIGGPRRDPANARRDLDAAPPRDDLELVDGEYLPIVKLAPAYPAIAASEGLEGYVVVEFTVTRSGTVRDVVVVESSHEVFHDVAVEATHRFRYKPRIVSGRPVEVSGVRNKIMFVLEA